MDIPIPSPSRPERSRRKRHRWLAGTTLGVLLLGTGGFYTHQAKIAKPAANAATSAQTITVAQVETMSIPRTLMVTGSLAARDDLPIGTETTDLAIAEVLVDVGDHVRQGQLLARFNDKVLRAQCRQAEAALTEAQANAAEAAANARRAEELVKTGWMSGKDYDNRHATALTMEARVGVAQANLSLAQARLQQAEIRAPADGTVTARNAHLGAVVSAGSGELFRMIRDDRVELVAELPETDLVLVKAGQAVFLTVDGGGGPEEGTPGVVRLVEPTVDVKTRIGRVRVDVEKDGALRPGMFVTGKIALGQTIATVVPERAIVYQNGKPLVFVIDQASRADFRTVLVGTRDHDRIAILSGVAKGERVAVQGAGYLKSGDLVTVASPPPDQAANATPPSMAPLSTVQ